MKEQGLVTVPIHFRTLEELHEEKNYLKEQIEKLEQQLKQENQLEKENCHEPNE